MLLSPKVGNITLELQIKEGTIVAQDVASALSAVSKASFTPYQISTASPVTLAQQLEATRSAYDKVHKEAADRSIPLPVAMQIALPPASQCQRTQKLQEVCKLIPRSQLK